MEDMVAMLHHPQLYASRCTPSMTSSYGWRAGGCGGSAIAQRIEDDLLHGGRSSAFTHMPATMEHKANTTPGIGLAGHGLASHLPGFDKEAAHKGREGLFKVSRSYSVLSTPSMLDLTPISIPPTDVSGFVDVSLSERRNSITKPVKLNPWVRSESEGATQGISHKEGAAGEYFPQRMIGAGASKLELIKKNVASPRLDGNQVQEGIAAATSPSTMKEAMERAALKIKLAKQARDGRKEREMESSNTTKSRDYRKQNKKAYEEEDREREAYDKCEIHRRKQQGSESRKTEDRECLYRGRDIGRERGREWEKHREDPEWVTWDTREGRDCIHEGPERLATTVQKRVNSIVRPTAETPDQVAAERKRAAVGEPMAESDKQAQHEAVHKMTKEAREGALLRAEVERAAANARERAERVVAAVRKQQQSKENDASSLIMRNSQTRSFSKQKDGSQNLWAENRKPSNERQEQGSFAGEFGANRKVFVTSTADAQTLLFNTGKFQEVDGETPECHSTRWECQHMQERVAKALQEKNQRDLQNEMEQAERHRASEMLDPSIKHWAAGKEGNLHVLLSNLHLILWPECGWQPISMIDLITTESVKKAYRKATLCVHPDKLQQKGATIQQKYMAEKIFDLLKDAWNKFQS